MLNRQQFTKAVIAGFFALSLASCAVVSGRESAADYADDAGITASVKTALLNEPGLKSTEISVETFQNMVQLSGFVASRPEATRAGQVASTVKGVRSVKNDIVVR
jgi:osmotically-inducible protein OsmY